MSLWTLIQRSLLHYWRTNIAVAAGVAVAAAAVVGSLIIGDSADGSLRHGALQRLGDIDYALEGQAYFRQDLLTLSEVVPAIMTRGAVRADGDNTVIPGVAILGVDDAFWKLFPHPPATPPQGGSAAISRSLAEALHASEGDVIILSLGRANDNPADTVFARTKLEDTLVRRRVTVTTVLVEESAGAFSLKTDLVRPRNVFVSREWLQRQLGEEGRVNLLLHSAVPVGDNSDVFDVLQTALEKNMTLDDYGIKMTSSTQLSTFTLVAKNIVLPTDIAATIMHAARETRLPCHMTSVYLANRMAIHGRTSADAGVPWSIVGVMDAATIEMLRGCLPEQDRPPPDAVPSDNEIILSQWAAEDIDAKVGDCIEVTLYRAALRGELLTNTRTFTTKAIVATAACVPLRDTVPTFEGMTDTQAMSDWDPPFEVDMSRIRPKDDDYWNKYGPAPKAFVSPETMRSMWMPTDPALAEVARWVTAFQIRVVDAKKLQAASRRFVETLLGLLEPGQAGLTFRPVRAQALAASKGTQDFAVLFLLMSFFLVAAAAGLIVLLMRLNVERRASQIGILLATGFHRRRASGTLVREGLLVALAGVLVGAPLGVLYARAILWALRTKWAGAVAEFPMRLYLTPASVAVGAATGFAVAALSVVISTRILRKVPGLVLLGGWRAIATEPSIRARGPALIVGILALALAASMLIAWGILDLFPAGAAFASAGMGLLLGSLAFFCVVLLRPEKRRGDHQSLSLGMLAIRGASRHWVRSLLTVGLLACAALLIVTVAAFRQDLSRINPTKRDSGAGGFQMVATSDVPIFRDLGTDTGREALGFTAKASKALDGMTVISMRRSEGDDISCLNLNNTRTPRVTGIPRDLIERGGFAFASTIASAGANPWSLLDAGSPDDTIPCFADAATAQWQIEKGLGDSITVPLPGGKKAQLKLVGTLAGSVLPGDLLVSENNFLRLFGRGSGYRLFLIETRAGDEERVARALRTNLGETGFDVRPSVEVLAQFAQVQNTYLSAFETLGGLGLLLGTFGVVTVLLRNVAERRGELAMLMAIGFSRSRLVGIVLAENAILLLLGVTIGAFSALVAAAPQLSSKTSNVNVLSLALTLLATIVLGVVSCAMASSSAVRGRLIDALRSE